MVIHTDALRIPDTLLEALADHFTALGERRLKPTSEHVGMCTELDIAAAQILSLGSDAEDDPAFAQVTDELVGFLHPDLSRFEIPSAFPIPHRSRSNKEAYCLLDNLWDPEVQATPHDTDYVKKRLQTCLEFAEHLRSLMGD